MRSFSLMPMRISAKMRISLVKVPSSDGYLRSLSLKRELYCSTNLGNRARKVLSKFLNIALRSLAMRSWLVRFFILSYCRVTSALFTMLK